MTELAPPLVAPVNVPPEPNYCIEWTCGGCGKPVDGAMARDKATRWCADCGVAYRTTFGRLTA